MAGREMGVWHLAPPRPGFLDASALAATTPVLPDDPVMVLPLLFSVA